MGGSSRLGQIPNFYRKLVLQASLKSWPLSLISFPIAYLGKKKELSKILVVVLFLSEKTKFIAQVCVLP